MKQIDLVANSNTEVIIKIPDAKADDFIIKLAKHYTDSYEGAEITVSTVKE